MVHANFPLTSDLGRINPTLFLSVYFYLIVYPMIQWGSGGYILAPKNNDEEGDGDEDDSLGESIRKLIKGSVGLRLIGNSLRATFQHAIHRNVLNNRDMVHAQQQHYHRHNHNHHATAASRTHPSRGLTSADEGCYMTELDLERVGTTGTTVG